MALIQGMENANKTSLTFALQSSFTGEAKGKSRACITAVLKTVE